MGEMFTIHFYLPLEIYTSHQAITTVSQLWVSKQPHSDTHYFAVGHCIIIIIIGTVKENGIKDNGA